MTVLQGLGISLALTGSALYLSSLTYKLQDARLDVKILKKWHQGLRRQPWVTIFRWIWPLGTTPVALVWLAILTIYNPRLGLITSAVLGITMGIEAVIKRFYARPRPFKTLTDVQMLQPSLPRDSSFPSGDALRIWFLALVVPVVIGIGMGNPFVLTVVILLSMAMAFMVSVGRVALGVHYPSDVAAGTGLGLIASSIIVFFLTIKLL
jgi:membrane-associated phospholipid phosphatase